MRASFVRVEPEGATKVNACVCAPPIRDLEQLVPLRDEQQRYAAAFGELITEVQNTHSAPNGSFDQRHEQTQKIQAKVATELQGVFLKQLRRENGL